MEKSVVCLLWTQRVKDGCNYNQEKREKKSLLSAIQYVRGGTVNYFRKKERRLSGKKGDLTKYCELGEKQIS